MNIPISVIMPLSATTITKWHKVSLSGKDTKWHKVCQLVSFVMFVTMATIEIVLNANKEGSKRNSGIGKLFQTIVVSMAKKTHRISLNY